MNELDLFRKKVECAIKSGGLTPTRFGVVYADDPNFVFTLRSGREPRLATREKVLRRINANPPKELTQ